MGATLLYYSKVLLVHRSKEGVAVAELKVWKVKKDKNYSEGVKYSLFLVWKDSGKIVVGFDNHKPKGHHMHLGNEEKPYEFKGVEMLIGDFWNVYKKEGFLV